MNELDTPGSPTSGIAARAKAILVAPKAEWPKIAGEPDSVQGVFTRYVVPLAAIGPVCSFIGGQLFGIGALGFNYHPSLIAGFSSAVTAYVLALIMIFVVAWVANFLADKFGGRENFRQAFKLCTYSFTAAWVAGVLNLIPALGILVLLASLYGIYLFYLGATPMMGVPQDKAVAYTAVTILGVIVIDIIVAAITSAIAGLFITTATLGGAGVVESGHYSMNVPGYGELKVEDNGNKQTMEIPGVGKVEVTKDGNTVKIDSENVKAQVKDPNAVD